MEGVVSKDSSNDCGRDWKSISWARPSRRDYDRQQQSVLLRFPPNQAREVEYLKIFENCIQVWWELDCGMTSEW